MSARTSPTAPTGGRSDQTNDPQGIPAESRPLDDIIDARFDAEGRIEQPSRGNRQRAIEKLEPRGASLSAADLERAVQKLARGLDSIERQGGVPAAASAGGAPTAPPEVVTTSLDRIEARLDALSRKLQQRSRSAGEAAATPSRTVGVIEHEPARAATSSSLSSPSRAASPAAGSSPGVEAPLPRASVQTSSRASAPVLQPTAALAAAGPSGPDLAAITRDLRGMEAESLRRAEEAARIARESAEASRHAIDAANDARAKFVTLEARIATLQSQVGDAAIEPLRDEVGALLGQVEAARNDRGALDEALEALRAKLDDIETKVNAGRNHTGNRISDIQEKVSSLSQRVGDIEGEVPGFDALREGQSAILERFDTFDGTAKLIAPLDQLVEHVDVLKREFRTVATQHETVRIEQAIIELADRLDALPGGLADRSGIERVEGQLQALALDFTETRRGGYAEQQDVKQRLAELYSGLREVAETGRTPDLSGLDKRLSAITAQIADDRQASSGAFSRLEGRLAQLTEAIAGIESAAAQEVISGIAGRMDHLDSVIRSQNPANDFAVVRKDLTALDSRLDELHQSLAEQVDHLARAQNEPLDQRFKALSAQVSERTGSMAAQLGPLAQKLQEISDRVSAVGGSGADPLAGRLAAIEEKLAGLSSRATDPRTLHNQLDNIVSRLELLKGRSVDPARLTELFDRVDTAIRHAGQPGLLQRIERRIDETAAALVGISSGEQLKRIERKLEDASLANPAQSLQRLERQITDMLRSSSIDDRLIRIEQKLNARPDGLADERFDELDRKLEDLGRAYPVNGEAVSYDDLGDLRGDIAALRRELRLLPGLGDGEASLGDVLQAISSHFERLPDATPATAADLESQIDRIAGLLEDPSHNRAALSHIEASLKELQDSLESAKRAGALQRAGAGVEPSEVAAVVDMARSLSNDVTSLRDSSKTTEKRTRDAFEAVHGTLEAVVKRMAFLERDKAFSSDAVAPPIPALQPTTDPLFSSQLPELGKRADAEAVAGSEPEFPVVEAKPIREASGFFSRFTSSQILKRATGGRAESFSPGSEDTEAADQPLEPGTNAPLASALSDAPSSGTGFFAGRKKKVEAVDTPAKPVEAKPDAADSKPVASTSSSLPVLVKSDDDFLTAARRAAQAAAAEATENARDGGTQSMARLFSRGRARNLALAGAMVVAAAFAAVQILRGQTGLDIPPLADLIGGTATGQGSDRNATETAAAGDEGEAAGTRSAPSAAAAGTRSAPSAAAAVASGSTAGSTPVEAPTASPGAVASISSPAVPDVPEPSATGPAADEPVATASLPSNASQSSAIAPSAGDLSGDALATLAPDAPDADVSAVPSLAPTAASPLPAGFPVPVGPTALQSAARAGDPAASFETAARYAEGRGVAADPAAAAAWYARAAEAGLAPAQYRLGSIYEKGIGVAKEPKAAQAWYARAADSGNVKAMHNLAVLDAEGAGGEPDLEKAAGLFRQAADYGVRDSQFNLAILHARGLGVKQDLAEAYKWFSVAAGSGDEEAAKRRDIIGAAMKPTDREKAQAAAASFQPKTVQAAANDVPAPEGGWGEEPLTASRDPDAATSTVGPAGIASMPALSDENARVALVQRLLAGKGYDPGPADGLLGAKTIDAIARFQASQGLPPTGEVSGSLVTALQGGST